jgi:hypothetical protein
VLLPPAIGAGSVDALSLTLGVWAATALLGAYVVRSGH